MALPLAMIVNIVSSLMNGPMNKVLESYVKDVEMRRKLQAELETNLVSHLGRSLELEQGIVLAEIKSENWLTANWRPVLMCLFMGFLVLVGFILPMADLAMGRSIPYNPRWASLPEGFWQFLSVGVGGYIGGRSLEKIAQQAMGTVTRRK